MDPQGKLVLLTGGNRGLGFAAAKKLAQRGLRVVLTSRSAQNADEAAARIRTEVPGAEVRGAALDLSSLARVREFTSRFLAEERALHVLLANAAVMSLDKTPRYSEDGHEATFAANHLGHFLLITELLPLLEAGAREAGEARVVVVSSRSHLPGSSGPEVAFDFDDLNLRDRYDPMVAYKNSKLANLWFTYELNRRAGARGITANALCPGFVPETTGKERGLMRQLLARYVFPFLPVSRTVDQATETYVFLATDPALKGTGGKFYGDKEEIASSPESHDPGKAARLWKISEELTSAGGPSPGQ